MVEMVQDVQKMMEPTMTYTTLGRTDLKVSVAGLGCGGASRAGQRTVPRRVD